MLTTILKYMLISQWRDFKASFQPRRASTFVGQTPVCPTKVQLATVSATVKRNRRTTCEAPSCQRSAGNISYCNDTTDFKALQDAWTAWSGLERPAVRFAKEGYYLRPVSDFSVRNQSAKEWFLRLPLFSDRVISVCGWFQTMIDFSVRLISVWGWNQSLKSISMRLISDIDRFHSLMFY